MYGCTLKKGNTQWKKLMYLLNYLCLFNLVSLRVGGKVEASSSVINTYLASFESMQEPRAINPHTIMSLVGRFIGTIAVQPVHWLNCVLKAVLMK